MSATDGLPGPEAVLGFWLEDRVRERWFRATRQLDTEIRERFSELRQLAADGVLVHWEATPEGAVALAILLDQLPLNMFRGLPDAFSTEAMAREVAARAILRGDDARLADPLKAFLFLPFMHSEDLADQDRALALFEGAGLRENLRWARHHRQIIERFGRFPHRNAILGRQSTPEEQAWLAEPGSFKG